MLATFLAYDRIPFDTSDGKVAANAKVYLEKTASWPRKADVQVLWNGVSKDDNPSKAQNPATPASVAPAIPPAANSCNPSPSGTYKDSHEDRVWDTANWFCDGLRDNVNPKPSPTTVSIAVTARADIGWVGEYRDNKSQDDVFQLGVKAIPGCTPPNGYWDFAEPVHGFKCKNLVHDIWSKCKFSCPLRNDSACSSEVLAGDNKGRGGSVVAGCIKYSLNTVY